MQAIRLAMLMVFQVMACKICSRQNRKQQLQQIPALCLIQQGAVSIGQATYRQHSCQAHLSNQHMRLLLQVGGVCGLADSYIIFMQE